MDDLEAISVDNDFTAEVKAKAKGIMGKLKGKSTLVLFHFLIDIVQELAKWSKQLQKRAGTLIRLEQYRTRMLESLRALKTHHGTTLQDTYQLILYAPQLLDAVRFPCNSITHPNQ